MKSVKRPKGFLIGGVAIILIFLLGLGTFFAVQQVSSSKRAGNMPPSVYIHSPEPGETVPADSMISVSASAVGTTMISELQFWLDGGMVDKAQNTTNSAGTFFGQVILSVSDGPHALMVRAVDRYGLVGQSPPFPLYGSAELADSAGLMVNAAQNDTLEEIAGRFDTNAENLNVLNPNLPQGGLPAGTEIIIPVTKVNEPEPQPPTTQVIQPEPIQTSGAVFLPAIPPSNPIADAWSTLTATALPQAPSGLTALADRKNCLLNIYWLDNSTTEKYFRVWMAGLGIPPRVVSEVKSSDHLGPVWYQFAIPPAGIYSFWVEAVNELGDQPSETVWVGIPATQCAQYTAANLLLEIKEITFYGFYDRLYSYLSVEGAPERRFPAHDGEFWFGTLNAERTTIRPLERNIISIPIPEDGALTLDGKSMAWLGGTLHDLGPFSTWLPANAWDGSDQVIEAANYRIVYSVQPFGSMEARGTYTFHELNLPMPFNLKDKPHNALIPPAVGRVLSWEWLGDERKITGFTVYLNGKPIKTTRPNQRQIYYLPPSNCGDQQRLQVAVNTNHGQSLSSNPLIIPLPPCPVLAEIQFISMDTGITNDSFSGKCDTIETYYEFWASGATDARKKAWGKPFFFPVKCNSHYTFDDIVYGFTKKRGSDRIMVPIDPNNPVLVFGLFAADYDWGSADDHLVMIKKQINKAIGDWPGYEEEFYFSQYLEAGSTGTVIRVKGLQGASP